MSNELWTKAKYIDSLELVIKDSRIDSVKLSAILSLTYIRGNENKAKHKELIYQGISIAEKSNNLSFKGLFLSEYAYSFRRENVIDSSFYYYKKAQETFIISKDSSKYYYVEYDFGNLKKDQGSYDESLKHFSKGIKFFETNKMRLIKKCFNREV